MSSKRDPGRSTSVGQAGDSTAFIELLDARRTIDGEREIKTLILELLDLRPGAHVLDIGCGLGDDAREMAGLVGPSGAVVGVDPNEALVAEARRRAPGLLATLELRTGDARALEFAASSFDAVRTDRVLTFVPEIDQALAEAFRVLRPGGRLVCSEVDHEVSLVDSPMEETSRAVFAAFAQTFAHGRLGRQLLGLMTRAGFRNVRSIPRMIRPPYGMFRRLYDAHLRALVEAGKLPQTEITRWLEGLEQADAGGVFVQAMTVFTACGEKP